MKKQHLFLFVFMMTAYSVSAQFVPNYDEKKVPEFSVPDPLTTFKGRKISNEQDWMDKRRPELFAFFESQVYGRVPGTLDDISFQVIEQSDDALDGTARRKQVKVTCTKNNRSLSFHILFYLPKTGKYTPIFLGYNFYGNHTITKDTNVLISKAWARNNADFGIVDHTLTDRSRGVRTNRWAIGKIIQAGFGLGTIYYGEVDPDKNDLSDGLHALFYKEGQKAPQADEWGSIAVWAFGLSKAMDYLETDSEIDATKTIVFGHSRLGKAALWAGATDKRFAGVISNNSGCGGAALSKRKFGETVGRINESFPHWFCGNFKEFDQNEEELPVDQHQLLSLAAPRPLYVASAQEDQWADPKGEFLSAYYASPVYALFGKKGIPNPEMPVTNAPIQQTVAYHIRTGAHDVTDYDWEQYLKWAKQQF